MSTNASSSTVKGKAVVIGGGVIGAACAHYLRRAGWQVAIIDQGRFGAACSASNCGLVCPSHILPLAEPGAIQAALKAMMSRDSPFSIKPRLDFRLWKWLLAFARRCNERDLLASGRAIQPLLDASMTLYQELIAAEGFDCEWETNGLLYAYKDKAAFEGYAKTERLLAERFGCPGRKIEANALAEFEPALKPGLAGGWFYDHDAQVRPDRLLKAWRASLEASGVEILEHREWTGFAVDGRSDQAARALTAQGEDIAADAFIVAAGSWTPRFASALGCRIPIQPGKGYSITMPRPEICPRVPLIFPETRVAVSPFQSGYRLGSTMEFAGYDDTLNLNRLQLLKDGAEPYLREPYRDPIEERWYGWRPMTTNSVPIIGRSPKLKNVVIAAGHNMLGLSMAPGTGKLAAQLLSGETPDLDPTPYRATRF